MLSIQRFGWLAVLLLAGRFAIAGQQPTAAGLRAGVAKMEITPQLPIYLSGYASRELPASGVAQPLWAKALAMEDAAQNRIVIITVDLLGLSHEIITDVTRRVQSKHAIRNDQLLFNSSHTHTGPVIWPCLDVVYELEPADQKRVSQYGHDLTDKLVELIDKAMTALAPVQVYSGHGQVGFAINRRNAIHPGGPVDHDVPVVKVVNPDGSVKAILFGYACHNTTVVDEYQQVGGDYAGYAQQALEQQHPGAVALFMMGCAGDQNPEPRGKLQHASDHGQELAAAVDAVLKGSLTAVKGPLQTAATTVDLQHRPLDIARYQADMVGDNKYLQRRAKLVLQAYNKGWKMDPYTYPLQVVRFGKDFTILALSDEVVVEYSLKTKARYPGTNLFVAGYSNKVDCYIPSQRILKEGGYEADDSMIYYGFSGPFADDVESRIHTAITDLMKKVGIRTKLTAN